jgi:hypothetical protein
MPGVYPQVHDVDQIDRYLNLNYIQGQKPRILSGVDMPKKGKPQTIETWSINIYRDLSLF